MTAKARFRLVLHWDGTLGKTEHWEQKRRSIIPVRIFSMWRCSSQHGCSGWHSCAPARCKHQVAASATAHVYPRTNSFRWLRGQRGQRAKEIIAITCHMHIPHKETGVSAGKVNHILLSHILLPVWSSEGNVLWFYPLCDKERLRTFYANKNSMQSYSCVR